MKIAKQKHRAVQREIEIRKLHKKQNRRAEKLGLPTDPKTSLNDLHALLANN